MLVAQRAPGCFATHPVSRQCGTLELAAATLGGVEWPGRREHVELLASAHGLVEELAHLSGRLIHGDTHHVVHTDFAARAAMLGRQLEACVALVEKDLYGPAFGLLRTALEQCCVDQLLFLGRRFLQVFTNVDEATWESWQAARERGDEWTRDIANWERLPRSGQVRIERIGLKSKDESDQQLSIFYFLLKDYMPLLGPPELQVRLDDGLVSLESRQEQAQENRDLYKRYLAWPAVKENLRINGMASGEELDRLQIHYRFLSAFAHPTSHTDELIYGRNHTARRYDHYSSELSLLYICALGAWEVRSFLAMTDQPPRVDVSDRAGVEHVVAIATDASSHLWFVWGQPHSYDRFVAANHASFAAHAGKLERQSVRPPEDLEPGDVGYYADPLNRLIRMHSSANELLGFTYISPWSRPDALFR